MMNVLSKEQRQELAAAAHQAGQEAFDWQDFNRKQIQQMALEALPGTKWSPIAEFEQVRLIWRVNYFWGWRCAESQTMEEPSIYERKLACFLPGAEMIEATDWYQDQE